MKKLRGQFRSTIWDPSLIVSQILAIQFSFYSSLGLWLSVVNFLSGTNSSLDLIFKYEEVHIHNYGGRGVIAAFVLNSATGAIALWFIVRRTKQCLDFAATAHFLHLLICWLYNSHFPTTVSWWLLNAACVTIMCVYGEYLCLKTELQAIPLSVGPKADLWPLLVILVTEGNELLIPLHLNCLECKKGISLDYWLYWTAILYCRKQTLLKIPVKDQP